MWCSGGSNQWKKGFFPPKYTEMQLCRKKGGFLANLIPANFLP